MDYSLLLGVRAVAPAEKICPTENPNEGGQCFKAHDGGMLSLPDFPDNIETPRYEAYYLGLVDILQEYSSMKKLEHFAKGLVVDKHGISAVPTEEYAHRLNCRVDYLVV